MIHNLPHAFRKQPNPDKPETKRIQTQPSKCKGQAGTKEIFCEHLNLQEIDSGREGHGVTSGNKRFNPITNFDIQLIRRISVHHRYNQVAGAAEQGNHSAFRTLTKGINHALDLDAV